MSENSEIISVASKCRRGRRANKKNVISCDNIEITKIEISVASLQIEDADQQPRSMLNFSDNIKYSTKNTKLPNSKCINDSKELKYINHVTSYSKEQTLMVNIASGSHEHSKQEMCDDKEKGKTTNKKCNNSKVVDQSATTNNDRCQEQDKACKKVESRKNKTTNEKQAQDQDFESKLIKKKDRKKQKDAKLVGQEGINDIKQNKKEKGKNKQEIKCDKPKCKTNKTVQSLEHKRLENQQDIDISIQSSPGIQKKSPRKAGDDQKFPEYIPVKEVKKLINNNDSNSPKYIQGNIRINPRFYKHAYIGMPDGEADLLVIGLRDRNRALEGDLVVVHVNPQDQWQALPNGKYQKTGTVICILEKVHPRKAVGHLKKRDKILLFHPRDQRMPLLTIYNESLLKTFHTQPQLYKDTLFLTEIVQWNTPYSAIGKVEKIVGNAGEIQAEIDAIIVENALNITPYDDELTLSLPSSDYVLTTVDIQGREDWREKCIFTIDPSTAVDLDDAVSCKILDNDNYEVGVHISDVTHYLKFLSPLDIEVAKRGTTVYMTDNVYSMLPKQLYELCSLLPGRDKLAFSVIWEITPDAEIIKHRFAKTVINSCCKMSYEHAQQLIDNPDGTYDNDFLHVTGDYSLAVLSQTVNMLHKLSSKLRVKRFANGALRIDQPKFHVTVDKTTGLPISYTTEILRDSNRLIEELMLLANVTVATHLYNTMPDTALLRQHNEPSERVLSSTRDMLRKFGIHLDIESSGSLQTSLNRYEPSTNPDNDVTMIAAKYIMMVINNLCSKAMSRALYKCASSVSTVDELKHYALSVPFYTHFTSPIRRYPDCIVHRLLHASIEGTPLPKNWNAALCAEIARTCNIKKNSAKMAQEQCEELYFTYLISLIGFINTTAIVIDVKEQNIDAMLCDIGIKVRICLADIRKNATIEFSTEYSVPTLTVMWKKPVIKQVINVFSIIHLKLQKHSSLFRLNGILLPPQ